METKTYSLDILGQQPVLRKYTQVTFSFPAPNGISEPPVLDTLTRGLERLCASFPWLAGQVVNKGAGDGSTGIFQIKSYGKAPRPLLKDFRSSSSMPTMDTIRAAGFPIKMLDENILLSRKAVPDPNASEGMPVFLVQASLLTGGLLLTFLGQHNAMDMTGQGHIIRLFSKACRGEEFTEDEISTGNRAPVIPLIEDESYKRCGTLLAHQTAKPAPVPQQRPSPMAAPRCARANFSFNAESLAALKSLAMETLGSSSHVSTDDVLSAYIWQSVSRARISRLGSTTESTFARAVNVRQYLRIPQTYPGLAMNATYHTYSLQKLVAKSALGSIASEFRSALDPRTSTLAYDSRALATYLDRTPDKGAAGFLKTINPSTDILLTSWAQLGYLYGLDFSLGLGGPEAIRRPQFDRVECLIYLLPRTPSGEIVVGMCLRDEDMDRLRADEDFATYARYIG